jgi:hypothetical protein
VYPNTGPHDLTPWLADATSTSPEQVEEELEEGDRRRAFVVNELVEAGFAGSMLLLQVIKLTGVDDVTGHALIAAQARAAPPAKADVPKRDRRLAENEILFRQVNEQIANKLDVERGPRAFDVVCECTNRDCMKALTIEASEYEWLRQNPLRFVVLPGHEAPAVEDVVERHSGYLIVEKHVETHDQVEAADPRS